MYGNSSHALTVSRITKPRELIFPCKLRYRYTRCICIAESDTIGDRTLDTASRNDAKRGDHVMKTNRLHRILFIIPFLLMLVLSCPPMTSEAADITGTKCKLQFSIQGWSVLYETASGTGTVTCDNGQSRRVKIDVKGGGLRAGKSSLKGTGTFSEVADIQEIFGAYAKAEAHAGVVKSAGAQVMTKGNVSLALAAKGKGINLGIAFGKFRIDPAGK